MSPLENDTYNVFPIVYEKWTSEVVLIGSMLERT
ncbi:hypothetical protein FOPG_19058 [Fusarium oxysporum f. sp. conglutinans race 2 54008]|uniref:Uncharacterized protein n=1 Tax=Fusarium oxysporum f. sp. conglutinans race 2 54008 TaxID=1089457 RepID=X0GN21_FUSOX|nr:hypothetical protein FOPG_19058 [Fusarium oxysporum f. sp. conglutinans race 2 54008]